MINTLTSLRLVFALLVFASHLVIISDTFSGHLFVEGYVGVSFFFILSGFIIAHNYTGRVNTPAERKDYYIARIARIYPLHLLTLIAAIALSGFAIGSLLSWVQLGMSATLTNAYIPRSDFFFAFNAPAWSLCCEQLFYISFPFILPYIKESRRLFAIILLCVIVMVAGAQITPQAYIKGVWYVNPVTRFPDFLIGIAVLGIYNRIKGITIGRATTTAIEAGSIVLFILFYIFAEDVPKACRYSFYYWLPISAVLLSFALQKGALSRILNNKAFILGGEISYSVYLVHLFIVNAIGAHLPEINAWAGAGLALAATLIMSYLSYRYYEKPMNRVVKRWLGYRK
ncbi:MAG: acyltransferase [Bacteroidaceae bacterium]|nr:acyltransferase [Bacteroidaceae bacterium]